MKINVKEEFVFIELKETKRDDFKVLIVGAKDFSGAMSFIVNTDTVESNLKKMDLLEMEFLIQVSNKKTEEGYKEVITNKRIIDIKKVKR